MGRTQLMDEKYNEEARRAPPEMEATRAHVMVNALVYVLVRVL